MKSWWAARKEDPQWWTKFHFCAAWFWLWQALEQLIHLGFHVYRGRPWIPELCIILLSAAFWWWNMWRMGSWEERLRTFTMRRDMWMMEQAMLHLRDCQHCQENVLKSDDKSAFDGAGLH